MPHSRSRRFKARRAAKANPRGVIELTGAGYGFVQTAEGGFFVPSSKTADAFDGDFVEVVRMSSASRGRESHSVSGGLPAARVVRVLGRAHETIVGRYEIAEPFGVVVPEDPRIKHDIFTLRREAPFAQEGDIVRVRITVYPSRREPAQGVVEEVLGHEGDAGVDVELVIARHKLETRFSEAAIAEAKAARVDAEGALFSEGYRDCTNRIVFTIDPDDARDFDDALSLDVVAKDGTVLSSSGGSDDAWMDAVDSIARGEALWRLGVHIADVSHYVPWDSPLDHDARRRATSVYLVDRVIPMLPEELSNDVCSLRPRRERRTFSVDMYLDAKARIVRADAFPSVIQSRARLTYGQVQRSLDALRCGDRIGACDALRDATEGDFIAVSQRIVGLDAIARMLHAMRIEHGGMDFEGEEARVRLDSDGHPLSVEVRVKTDATSLVEEAMIAANEAVARILRDAKAKSIYRVHEPPSPADLSDLIPILQEFGYGEESTLSRFASGDPFAIQNVLALARGRREENLVSSLVVRAMKRAVYRDSCERHFGLASDAYVHFTSPIRRYPDLMVHRALKRVLFGRDESSSAVEASTAAIAAHSSEAERVAETAARESQELKLYELLEQRVGQEEDGIVSGVASSGFFVRLTDTCEGFVSLRGEGEYWILDARRRLLTGSDSGSEVRLGMGVRVRIKDVRPLERRADFQLVASPSNRFGRKTR